jgi:hypothetical protein
MTTPSQKYETSGKRKGEAILLRLPQETVSEIDRRKRADKSRQEFIRDALEFALPNFPVRAIKAKRTGKP